MVWMVRYMYTYYVLIVYTGNEKDDIDEEDDNESNWCFFWMILVMM